MCGSNLLQEAPSLSGVVISYLTVIQLSSIYFVGFPQWNEDDRDCEKKNNTLRLGLGLNACYSKRRCTFIVGGAL